MLLLLLLVGTLDMAVFTHTFGLPVALGVACFLLHVTLATGILGQQRRLIAIAPNHTEVVLALNNSGLYLGVALGAAAGGAMLSRGLPLSSVPLAGAGLMSLAFTVLVVSVLAERARRVRLAH